MSLSSSKLDVFPKGTGQSEDYKPLKQIMRRDTLKLEGCQVDIHQFCLEIRPVQFQ